MIHPVPMHQYYYASAVVLYITDEFVGEMSVTYPDELNTTYLTFTQIQKKFQHYITYQS